MAKKIAVDWDEHELRIVAGRTSPGGVTITDAWAIPIEGNDPEAVTRTLRDELAARGHGKQATLLAIGRGKAELRQLKLPPIPDEELPEIVRFQATRDFATAGDRAITDFVPSRRTDEGVEVVAAALDPNQLDLLRNITTAAGLEVQRVALRPLSAAALFAAKQPTEGEVVLIDLLANDADIVVLRDGQARFVRSVRLPGDAANRPSLLAGEVRRSLMACRDSKDSQEVKRRLLIWGRAEVHGEDVRVLAERTGDHVETLDPLSLVDVERKLMQEAPEHIGRFAPLIGLLHIDEVGSELMIDFLNPRKPPEPKNDRLRYAVFGSLAAAAVLLIGYLVWNNLSTRDAQIAELQAQLNGMAETVKASDEQVAKVDKVDEFLAGNVIWLDEIRRVATEMPPSDQAILTSLSAMVPPRAGGGQLTLAGAVTSPDVIDSLEASLRDDQHRVVGEGATAARSDGPYDWGFRETVIIEPEAVLAMRREADQVSPPETAARETPAPAEAETNIDEPAPQTTDAEPRSGQVEGLSDADAAPEAPSETTRQPANAEPPANAETSVNAETPAESTEMQDNAATEVPAEENAVSEESESPEDEEVPTDDPSTAESDVSESDEAEQANEPGRELEEVQ